ncbi:PREDICTED: uncharacterized protein LOC106817763, partial [Priapulus caudatus]|uniref:Uncharacterized protein LOC106817763 n=1 Tax=Priapulus caudatus TaxID=37621 RepID=A0ABM1F0I1_PRICU
MASLIKVCIPKVCIPKGYILKVCILKVCILKMCTNGVHPKAVHPKGVHPEGVHPECVHPECVHPKGVHPKGVHPKGVHPKGVHPKGVHPKDVHPNGVHPKDVHPNGVHPKSEDYITEPLFGKPIHETHIELPFFEGQKPHDDADEMLGDASYRYLTSEEMKGLGDDSVMPHRDEILEVIPRDQRQTRDYLEAAPIIRPEKEREHDNVEHARQEAPPAGEQPLEQPLVREIEKEIMLQNIMNDT